MVCPLLVAGFKSFLKERPNTLRWLACGFLVAVFVWSTAFFYLPGLGFTYLVQFGSRHHDRYLPEVKAMNHYEAPDSPGYDSQWYVQIALHPRLRDPVLAKSVDSLPYRAKEDPFRMDGMGARGRGPVARDEHLRPAKHRLLVPAGRHPPAVVSGDELGQCGAMGGHALLFRAHL